MALKAITLLNGAAVGVTYTGGAITPADRAVYNAFIKDDTPGGAHRVIGEALGPGVLHFPRRGWIKLLPGDVVCTALDGMPFIITPYALTIGQWGAT